MSTLLATGGALCLLAGAAAAAELTQARGVLRALELDATAIRDTTLPIDAVQREAVEMQKGITQLPLLLGAQSGVVDAIEVAMRGHVAQLAIDANSPDRFLSSGDAADLLNDLVQLRNATGLGR